MNTKQRLQALGHNPATLPNIATCGHCHGAETLGLSLELLTGEYQVWCGCGHSSDAMHNLHGTILNWNVKNYHLAQREGGTHVAT